MSAATNREVPGLELEFARALYYDAGLAPIAGETIPGDGKLRRFRLGTDKHGCRSGWAVLHVDGVALGIGGDWRTGERITWTPNGQRLSAADRRQLAATEPVNDFETPTVSIY